MSLAEVLPEVQSLSRLDKIRLIQFLAQELERDGRVGCFRGPSVAGHCRRIAQAAKAWHTQATSPLGSDSDVTMPRRGRRGAPPQPFFLPRVAPAPP